MVTVADAISRLNNATVLVLHPAARPGVHPLRHIDRQAALLFLMSVRAPFATSNSTTFTAREMKPRAALL